MRAFETIILTSPGRQAIHAAALRERNPDMVFHIHESIMPAGMEAWRNCDRNIIDAWRDLRAEIQTRHALFLEWDVYANCDLEARLGPVTPGLVGPLIRRAVSDRRSFPPFREADRLPGWIRGHAIGLVPSALLLAPAELLDQMADEPRCRVAFEKDIISEIRFGSMAKALGYPVWHWPGLAATVGTRPRPAPLPFEEGIFHPVKKEVAP